MTVTTTARLAGPFVGNSVTVSFPFAFKVFAATDVVVVQAIAGVQTILVQGTDYSVTLNADQDNSPGGTVNFVAAPDNTRTLVITSNVPQTQTTVVTNNGGFFPDVFNAVFDRAVILIQQLAQTISRSLTIPITAVGVTSLQIAQVPNGVLTWSADGSQIIALPLSAAALVPALPNMAGKSGFVLTNDGIATASWLDLTAFFSKINYVVAAVQQVPTLAQINAAVAAGGGSSTATPAFAIAAAIVF